MKRFVKLLGRFIYEKRRYLFYGYIPEQGEGTADPHVKVYAAWDEIPPRFRRRALGTSWMNAMYYRLRRGEARLLCYSEDGQRLDAYGWIQDWRPFRRRFGALAKHGTMLGFYWTAPEARGRGLYGRLLSHSLTVCSKDHPILIVTSPENKASQRGIDKAGFKSLGEWEGRILLRWFSQMHKIPQSIKGISNELS
ncbi:MAG: hypothetical protein RBS84_00480 [Kiritimatiellia bacterium]|jgi:GNAT superfamily N-acetyltransferase|nr:hypothetical protein [Kiritimatiellia bacterium]